MMAIPLSPVVRVFDRITEIGFYGKVFSEALNCDVGGTRLAPGNKPFFPLATARRHRPKICGV